MRILLFASVDCSTVANSDTFVMSTACLLWNSSCYYYNIIDITSPPKSVNIAISRTAEFNCMFIGDIFAWEANRIQIVDGNMGYMFNELPVGTQPTR